MAKKQVEPQAKATPGEGSQPERKLVLTVKDRLLFGEFFPERSNLLSQMIVEDIAGKIRVSKEEREKINLRLGGQGVVWDEPKARDMAVVFTEVEAEFLKAQVERLDNAGSFTVDTAKVAKKIKAL